MGGLQMEWTWDEDARAEREEALTRFDQFQNPDVVMWGNLRFTAQQRHHPEEIHGADPRALPAVDQGNLVMWIIFDSAVPDLLVGLHVAVCERTGKRKNQPSRRPNPPVAAFDLARNRRDRGGW
jgi:hypothetical protein